MKFSNWPSHLGCVFDCFFSFLAVLTTIFGFYAPSRISLVVLTFFQLQNQKSYDLQKIDTNKFQNFSKIAKNHENREILKKSEFSENNKNNGFEFFSKILIFSRNFGPPCFGHFFRVFFQNWFLRWPVNQFLYFLYLWKEELMIFTMHIWTYKTHCGAARSMPQCQSGFFLEKNRMLYTSTPTSLTILRMFLEIHLLSLMRYGWPCNWVDAGWQ